jgi:thiamine-monophosphate kinase
MVAVSDAPDEFGLIAELFAPLARSYPGALGLTDDVALMSVPCGQDSVVTVDAMVEGVHFLAADPADLVARKLIRVNLSDLAAKGAVPTAIMLAAAFPRTVSRSWLRLFADGLRQDVEAFGIALIGGDTVATPGPLTLSLTAFGQVATGTALLRRSARVGDRIWVSGTIGDAALGLEAAQGRLKGGGGTADLAFLSERYRLPRPRVDVGPLLIGIAHAGMDISDGLIQDLGHLCRASGVGAEIRADLVPLSPAMATILAADQSRLATVLTGGDDYELLFTAAPEETAALAEISIRTRVPLTAIGSVVAQAGVVVLRADGTPVVLERTGWRHFRSEEPGDRP